jgi:two-component system, cell cycle response regulator DivK
MMGRLILVVEDHEDNRRILRDLLTNAGFQLIEAETGPDGVEMAQTHQPDLILMDLQLPGIDGYEAARQIRADPKLTSVAIIAVTSYALSGDEQRALAAGCNAYVCKPYSPRELLARIRELLPASTS